MTQTKTPTMALDRIILPLLFTLVLVACRDDCRYVEPAIGNPIISFTLVDTSGTNVFDERYDISAARLIREGSDELQLDIDHDLNTLSFSFAQGSGFDVDYTDEYILRLDSLSSEQFVLIYRKTEVGECGGWKYEFVNLVHDGQLYIRRSSTDMIEITL